MGWLTKLATLAVGNPIVLLWIAGGVLVAGLAAGGAAAWKVQGWRLDAAEAKLDSCHQQVAVLGDKIKQQNDAVQQWQDAAAKARQNAAGATKRAKVIAESHSALVASLDAKSKAPRAGEGPIKVLDCKDALSELRAVIR